MRTLRMLTAIAGMVLLFVAVTPLLTIAAIGTLLDETVLESWHRATVRLHAWGQR